MTSTPVHTDSYQAARDAYTTSAQDLLSSIPAPTQAFDPDGAREIGPTTSARDVLLQAERLAPISNALTGAIAARLVDRDPGVRSNAQTHLLAKALADLSIGLQLNAFASSRTGARAATSSTADQIAAAQALQTLRAIAPNAATPPGQATTTEGPAASDSSGPDGFAEQPVTTPGHTPGEEGANATGEPGLNPAAPTVNDAANGNVNAEAEQTRSALTDSIDATLSHISANVGDTVKTVINGLVAMSLPDLAAAAGVVGGDIANAIGLGEEWDKLYVHVRDYILKAYDSLLTLLGRQVAQMASDKLVNWLDQVRAGQIIPNLIEQFFVTQATRTDLSNLVSASAVEPGKYTAAIEGLSSLHSIFTRQTELSDKLLKGLQVAALVPVGEVPQVKMILVAANLLVGGFVVVSGADFVDAPRMNRLLNRVPGVRQVVMSRLS